jgi:hypothetical protein
MKGKTMIEISADEIIDKLLKKKDSCTMREVYDACMKYRKKHTDTYIDASGDTVDYYIQANPDKYWWDYKAQLIRKQEILMCPLCEDKHRKYPNTEKFSRLKALANGYGQSR